MKPVAFEYVRPTMLAEAAALLGEPQVFSKALAGGQSLGPMLNLRLAQPDLLVDITSIPELTAVADGQITSSSAPASPCRYRGRTRSRPCNWLASPGCRPHRLSRGAQSRDHRRALHADPAADWISALALVDARAVV
jgi:carbon-monoxide dehydrogenase medium subunit